MSAIYLLYFNIDFFPVSFQECIPLDNKEQIIELYLLARVNSEFGMASRRPSRPSLLKLQESESQLHAALSELISQSSSLEENNSDNLYAYAKHVKKNLADYQSANRNLVNYHISRGNSAEAVESRKRRFDMRTEVQECIQLINLFLSKLNQEAISEIASTCSTTYRPPRLVSPTSANCTTSFFDTPLAPETLQENTTETCYNITKSLQNMSLNPEQSSTTLKPTKNFLNSETLHAPGDLDLSIRRNTLPSSDPQAPHHIHQPYIEPASIFSQAKPSVFFLKLL